jgi:type IV secretory pathway VirB4 component
MEDYDITPIGYTNWRNQNIPFGIKDKDRLGHIYCIGKTGMGKSTLLQKIAFQILQKAKVVELWIHTVTLQNTY